MKKQAKWQDKHGEVISSFLKYLNNQTDGYILKGGTALMACYNLDRFSEDVDLDGVDKTKIQDIVSDFCDRYGYSYRIAKDTDLVKRYMINYGNIGNPLKVETSFRKKSIDKDEYMKINGVSVYKIDSLCLMKATAYMGRDKIRDLYDLSFICDEYWNEISPAVKSVVRNAIEHKGIEQFDYIIKDQYDPLIDIDKLATSFLKMHDKLGLLYDKNEQKIVKETLQNSKVAKNNQKKIKKIDLER